MESISKRLVPWLAGLSLVIGIAIAFASLPRSLWLDEFDIIAQTRGLAPSQFLNALRSDAHPLLYTGLIYGAQAAGISDIAVLRGLNIIGLPWALWPLWICWRRGVLSLPEVSVAVALYASSPNFLITFADIRPYFILSSASLAVSAVWLLMMRHDRTKATREPILIWTLCLAVFVNLHYFATLFGGVLTFFLLCQRAARREWRSAAIIAATSLFVAVPALALAVLQTHDVFVANYSYWIPAGLGAASSAAGEALLEGAAFNVPAVICAAIGLRGAFGPRADRGWTHILLVAAIALFYAVLMVAHLLKPMIVERYLTAATGAITIALAIFTCAPPVPKWAPLAACVCALLVQGATIVFHWTSRHGWQFSAERVAAMNAACPTTQIYTVPFARVNGAAINAAPINPMDLAGRRLGYQYYASRLKFSYTELKPGNVVSAAGKCPSLVWFEHFWPVNEDTPEDVLQPLALRAAGPAEVKQIGDGSVIVLVRAAK